MRCVRLYTFYDQFLSIKTVEFRRVCVKKAAGDDCLRRVFPFLAVQAVLTAEVGNAAFCGNSCSSEKNDFMAFVDHFLQFLLFFFCLSICFWVIHIQIIRLLLLKSKNSAENESGLQIQI